MKIFKFLLLTLAVIFAFRNALFNFFTQDDFILINQFSQNNLVDDFKNAFGLPVVTHWRPVHNLYFLIAGNLFGKNIIGYHLLTISVHMIVGFLIYLIAKSVFKSEKIAFISSFLYLVNPSHFVTIFWISGSAGTIGLAFLASSFYVYLKSKHYLSLLLFVASLLTLESMVVGIALFFGYEILINRKARNTLFLIQVTLLTLTFLALRYWFFTPQITFDFYKIEISTNTIGALKYYILRTIGFAEVSGDLKISLTLLGLVAFIIVRRIVVLTRDKFKRSGLRLIGFYTLIIIVGFFPFILIPGHLSPHYVIISIWGFSTIMAIALEKARFGLMLLVILTYFVIAASSVVLTQNNNWVIEKSKISKYYLGKIEEKNLPKGSLLIFQDGSKYSSKEAYIALGTGEAIDFWFKDKKYSTCFAFFENCTSVDGIYL